MNEIVGLSGKERDRLVVLRRADRGQGAGLRRRVPEVIAERYADYAPTRVGEMLERYHGLRVNRETLRQWMIEAGLWKPRKQRLGKGGVHEWPARGVHRGEPVQWDPSDHDWLDGRSGGKVRLNRHDQRRQP